MNTTTQKLATRDFIAIGIYSVIYAVLAFAIGGITQMTPVTFPFMPMTIALVNGTVFMLFVAKIPKKGALTILGIITGILTFIVGMFWMMAIGFILLGALADVVCSRKNYKSFKMNLIGYSLLGLAPMGGYVPILAMPEQFKSFMEGSSGDMSAYMNVVDKIGSAWWPIPLMFLGTILCAVIGGLIGKKLMKKHFKKAGIV
ncbi:MAG: MptD family putative ECF transporter S component [Suipraeoptans sp.]